MKSPLYVIMVTIALLVTLMLPALSSKSVISGGRAGGRQISHEQVARRGANAVCQSGTSHVAAERTIRSSGHLRKGAFNLGSLSPARVWPSPVPAGLHSSWRRVAGELGSASSNSPAC